MTTAPKSRRRFAIYFLLTFVGAALLGVFAGKIFCEINDYFSQKNYRLECLELRVENLENANDLN